eukprot:TRINITY_DN6405_c0_g1_i1.p1 TRINITY_DN6405_c0_g1~~TRINITY_DN6405_c0_g1_i1.p1  ORF type:complete len:344 (-),score=36.53 TRINITY_DN6405_c0_g1_i1:109-1140(-)
MEFDAALVIHTLFVASNLFFQLDKTTLLNITLVSTTISKLVRSLISEHCYFTFKANGGTLSHYLPRKLRVSRLYLEKILTVPHLKCVTSVFILDNKPLSSILPLLENIKSIKFDNSFNQYITPLPLNTNRLVFGKYFNTILNENIPSTVTSIKFGSGFDKPLYHLPSKLTRLKLGHSFNCSISGVLPLTLTHLSFGACFDQIVDGFLPPNIVYLKFSTNFSQTVNDLPLHLTHLLFTNHKVMILADKFNQSIEKLPQSITRLELNPSYKRNIIKLPASLAHLVISLNYYTVAGGPLLVENFPPTLRYITMYSRFQPSKQYCLPHDLPRFIQDNDEFTMSPPFA